MFPRWITSAAAAVEARTTIKLSAQQHAAGLTAPLLYLPAPPRTSRKLYKLLELEHQTVPEVQMCRLQQYPDIIQLLFDRKDC